MKKPKCENCGAETIEFFSKTGLKAHICPNLASGGVRTLGGRLIFIEMPCRIEIDGPLATFEKQAKVPFEVLRKATRYTIPGGQLLGHANAGMLADIPPERIPALFVAATTLGLVTAKTPLESIETLVYGIRNKSPRRLDNISINMFGKADEARRKYPNLDPDLAWKLYACDLAEDLAKKLVEVKA